MLKVSGITCQYETETVISGLDLTLAHGDIGCLLGPSGCGKSTVLRAIAGFQSISAGTITMDGRTLSTSSQVVVPEKRNIGMVFQDYALFPHLTVEENIGFGLSRKNKGARSLRVKQLAETVDLATHLDKYPHELSGGQQQRVALARALAPAPELILLDEPFSNLDTDLRRKLSLEVRNILKEMGISGILVTHDQQEAFAVSDYVGVIHEKKITQWDTPYNLYHEPVTPFVAKFVGQGSFIPGTVLSHDSIKCELGLIKGNRAYSWEKGTEVSVLIRPDDIVYAEQSKHQVKIVNKLFTGASTTYSLQLASGMILDGLLPSHVDFYVGQSIKIALSAKDLIAFQLDQI